MFQPILALTLLKWTTTGNPCVEALHVIKDKIINNAYNPLRINVESVTFVIWASLLFQQGSIVRKPLKR